MWTTAGGEGAAPPPGQTVAAEWGLQTVGPAPPTRPPPPLGVQLRFSLLVYSGSRRARGCREALGCLRCRRAGSGRVEAQALRQAAARSDRKTSAWHWTVARPSGNRAQLRSFGDTSLTHAAWGREKAEGPPRPDPAPPAPRPRAPQPPS